MTEPSTVLDEAFDRMAASDFELPNGFVNHGPMACEALDALGLADQIDGWSRRFVEMVGAGPRPEAPRSFSGSGWTDALGDYERLPEWIGHFERALDGQDWRSVVGEWVPRLVPGLRAALFHGVVRTGHAVRAVDAADTAARRAELARSLAYWAARWTPGDLPPRGGRPEPVDGAVVAAAALGARHFVAQPSIVFLHGVTGAMAVDLLMGHLTTEAARAGASAQLRAEHAAMYPAVTPVRATAEDDDWDPGLAARAAGSGDAHQVKLVEACLRGASSAGDRVFLAAARRVTGGTRDPYRPGAAGTRSR